VSDQTVSPAQTRHLGDLEEIRRLQYDYCFHGDRFSLQDSNRRDKMAELFGTDGVWDLVPGLRCTGTSQIEAGLSKMGGLLGTVLHIPTGGRIDIDGDEARGTWYGLFPCAPTGSAAAQPEWVIGSYIAEYRRTAEGWRFKYLGFKGQMAPGFLARRPHGT
jgi:hypothetical protein